MLYDKKWDKELPVTAPEKKLEPWQETVKSMIEVLETRGWCQGRIRDGQRVCLGGALRLATTGSTIKVFSDEATVVWELLSDRLGTRAWVWNDTKGRTKEEVIDFLKGCLD